MLDQRLMRQDIPSSTSGDSIEKSLHKLSVGFYSLLYIVFGRHGCSRVAKVFERYFLSTS